MAEPVLSALLSVLFEKLTSELLSFATREGVGSKLELEKLKKTFELIDELLVDAEQKHLTDKNVKKWLDELQHLAYDAEDILDEYATEVLRRKLKIEEHQASTSTARKLIPSCCFGFTPSAVSSKFSMQSEIDGITTQLEEHFKRRFDLGLKIARGRSDVSWQRPPTASFPTEPVVHGRDDDKTKILEILRNETTNSTFEVVPIVGMGGIGKTTLARQVYKAVEDFNVKAWACVSDDFDVMRISKAIFESITCRSCDPKNLDAVQNLLVKEVAGKRFLLVLDDIWSLKKNGHNLWEDLTAPFTSGARGSKIIVTTRLHEVARTLRLKGYYTLDCLSDEDCWSLFKQYASEGRDDVARWNVEEIRQKVVQKCAGLPLAAKTLGGLLRLKEKEEEWMEILHNKIWDLASKDDILPILRLSYYHLPSNLKRCFAYCSIFPKDYEFEERELVLLWIAEGFIQQSGGDNKQLEKIGGEYFHDLVSRSIFQISSTNISKFIMHDLINDLAQIVSRGLSFRLEGRSESNNESTIIEKARYSSYICQKYNGKENFEVFKKFKLLRTHLSLRLGGYYFCSNYISNSVVSDVLLKFKKLRTLSFQGYDIIELPNSIGGLILLKHLNLSYCGIRSLPESINSMCNLQTLLLKGCCRLSKLPYDMGNLINLRHIDIFGANLIEKMPSGISKWKFLQTLSNFIVGKNVGSNLKDLTHLKFLCGKLHISKLENVIDFENREGEIILRDKKDLKVLSLEWGLEFDDSRNEEDKKVLDMLQPHENLKELTIRCYGGTKFPSWVGDHNAFFKMMVLTLEGCKKCTSLPSLGMFASLRDLKIIKMTGLKSIGSEFYGGGSGSNTFRCLETLHFEDLTEWERWENEGVESFPKLRELSIVNCPKLSEALPTNLSLLEKLVIHQCAELAISVSTFPMLCEVDIDECKNIALHSNLSLLEKLVIRKCAELAVSVSTFPMLCEVDIDECKKIVCNSPSGSKSLNRVSLSKISDFGNWLKQEDFQRIEVLTVKGCDELIHLWQNEILLKNPPQGLHCLISIRELNIKSCHSLTFIFRGQLPPYLKKLYIEDCEKLQCLLDDNESTYSSSSMMHKENVNSHTSHLEELKIRDCPSLRILCLSTNQFFAMLTSLCIRYCSNLTTLSLPPVALKCLDISFCPELTTLSPKDQLPETLETLSIYDCGKLESIVERFHNNKALYQIGIYICNNLKSITDGLHALSSLREIHIEHCPYLVSLPKGGFPCSITRVEIWGCEKLKALPSQIHTLTSLRELYLKQCPSLSYPEEGFPANLSILSISSPNLYKPLTNWGLHNLTSLKSLYIHELSDAETFHEEEMEMTLPPTLTDLRISYFPKLKFLSCKRLENLTSLESLEIIHCPELKSLPSLPSSLLRLYIYGCPLLKAACKRDKGKECSYHNVGGKFIYDPEED